MIFCFSTATDENPEKIIKEKIVGLTIYNNKLNEAYYINIENNLNYFKEILENKNIKKVGIDLTKSYILCKQEDIALEGIYYDIKVAAYILNPTNNKLQIENLIANFLEIDVSELIQEEKQEQINLFEQIGSSIDKEKQQQ